MVSEEKEDVMHKREIVMADGKRKLYFFTFDEDDEADDSSRKAGADDKAKENSNE